jgi:hypothetical protein
MANAEDVDRRTKTAEEIRKEARNEDPISGQPGAHPESVGVGTAAGGALGGALGGAVGGPVGAAIGAVIGGGGGGLAGKAVGEKMDPTVELEYWRENFQTRDYATGARFEDFEPAYRYGIDRSTEGGAPTFDKAEAELQRGWSHRSLSWDRARPAVRDAYQRACDRGIASATS